MDFISLSSFVDLISVIVFINILSLSNKPFMISVFSPSVRPVLTYLYSIPDGLVDIITLVIPFSSTIAVLGTIKTSCTDF